MNATITAAERENAIQLLESRKEMLLATVAGLSQEQWHFKPASERWSIAEIVEHLSAVETFVPAMIQARVLSSDPIAETLEANDLALVTRVAGRRSKVQAAEMARPKGRWLETELIAVFCAARDKTVAYAAATQDDLRHHTGAHPSLGVLDGYQWLLFLAAHVERHIAQIRELQATPDYPVAEKVDSR